ncbi:MAG: redoxin domain-containing protein [Deltaproteobacteria bacterium]|nr:redoxin domain-containing protein [Deltaproteobacteria bacterium]
MSRSLFFAAALACLPAASIAAPTAPLDPARAPSAPAKTAPPKAEAKPAAPGVVGKAAPDFTLKDLDGKPVKLSSFKGKIVVLEWFNPGCPYVKKSHTVGSLIDTAKKHTAQGVVWLAINSGAAGKQGHEPKMNAESAKTWAMTHPILRDVDGTVGKAYGATNTPHMFVIDKKGVVAYGGAIDNSPDAEKQAPTGGTLINYVDAAVEAVTAGKTVATATTKAYGCGVKYGS